MYIPWYQRNQPELVEYGGPVGYDVIPTSQRTVDVSQEPAPAPAEQESRQQRDDEMRRRGFITRHEPLLPANQLGDSLSGLGMPYDTWRDIVDAAVLLTGTPAAGTGILDLPFVLDTPPTATATGLSAPLQQLLRDVRTPRLALCVRAFAFGTGGTGASGAVVAQLVTSSGDVLPLGIYSAQPTNGQALGTVNVVGPTPMTNLSGTQHVQLLSLTVAAPVAVTVQLAFSFLAVHPHSLIKRFSQFALNE